MRRHVVAVTLTFAFAIMGFAGEVREVGAVANEQANCVGHASSAHGRAVGAVISELAQDASTDCGAGGPEPPKKGGPIGDV